nr:transposase [Dokdonella sp.]
MLCWVLMPDHWHGLVQLGQRDSLPIVVNRFKSRVAKAVRFEGGAEAIWARADHDRDRRRDEDMTAIARYIVLNPVRAGLARRVGDYAFWDAAWL